MIVATFAKRFGPHSDTAVLGLRTYCCLRHSVSSLTVSACTLGLCRIDRDLLASQIDVYRCEQIFPAAPFMLLPAEEARRFKQLLSTKGESHG